MPAMCGAAIDVPLSVSVALFGMKPLPFETMQPVDPPLPVQTTPVCADAMPTPGAAMSGFNTRGPGPLRGPRDEKLADHVAVGNSVTFSAGICARSVVPSACDIMHRRDDDRRIDAAPCSARPPLLFAMMTAIAPASCAFFTLTANPQRLRDRRARCCPRRPPRS